MNRTGFEPGRGLRVVVADDHPVVRAGLTAVLGDTGDMKVVAESPDGQAAVRDTLLHRPDVLVLDLHLRGLGGEALIREVRLRAPETGVLVFSATDDESLLAALRAGARGYLSRTSMDDQIVRAVADVAAGRTVLSPDLAARARALLSRPVERDGHPFPELTTREREVLALLATGMPNPAIARELRVAGKTVSNHISNIYAKLGLADRYAAIVRARRAGIGWSASPEFKSVGCVPADGADRGWIVAECRHVPLS